MVDCMDLIKMQMLTRTEIDDFRFKLIAANFRHLKQYLKYYSVIEVDGILADFGVSSHQFNEGSRGFSIREEGRLDMRMRSITRFGCL